MEAWAIDTITYPVRGLQDIKHALTCVELHSRLTYTFLIKSKSAVAMCATPVSSAAARISAPRRRLADGVTILCMLKMLQRCRKVIYVGLWSDGDGCAGVGAL